LTVGTCSGPDHAGDVWFEIDDQDDLAMSKLGNAADVLKKLWRGASRSRSI
jgi:hypothetical protein